MMDRIMTGSDDLVSGIFSYCDRWCERCASTERCALFAEEKGRRSRLLLAGRDPDDWSAVVDDVTERLVESIALIRVEAAKMGLDFDEPEALPEEMDFMADEHPLNVAAREYTFGVAKLLKRLNTSVNEVSVALTDQDSELEACLDIISWYHIQVATKVFRALTGKRSAAQDGDPDPEHSLYDARGSAKVAHLGLRRSLHALTRVQELRPSLREDALPLLLGLCTLIEGIDQELPGHRAFKRPGFDD